MQNKTRYIIIKTNMRDITLKKYGVAFNYVNRSHSFR